MPRARAIEQPAPTPSTPVPSSTRIIALKGRLSRRGASSRAWPSTRESVERGGALGGGRLQGQLGDGVLEVNPGDHQRLLEVHERDGRARDLVGDVLHLLFQ